MRILLLGADGFLGRHVARELHALPASALFTGGRRSGHTLRLDLATAQPSELAAELAQLRPEAVVNCAGAVAGSGLVQSGVNARGPALLCEALREGAPRARLVHLGSAGEYGACEPGAPLTERSQPRPVGLYGASKLTGSLAVAQSGLDAVVLRVFNPVGPGSPAASLPGRLAAELAALASTPGAVLTVGDLSAHRDFVDVRDVARAVRAAVLTAGPLPRIVNIGSGRAESVRAIAEGLVAASGFTGTIEESGAGSERSAQVSWQQADITAADRELGWRPAIPLGQSLRDLWQSVGESRLAAVR